MLPFAPPPTTGWKLKNSEVTKHEYFPENKMQLCMYDECDHAVKTSST